MNDLLRRRFLQGGKGWRDYATAVLLALGGIAVVYLLEHMTIEHFSNISGFLIIAVLLSAVLFGTGPAILTALVCSLLYDWLLVPPLFTAATSFDNVIKFTVFVTAALLSGAIVGQAKRYAVTLAERERELITAIETQETLRQEKQREVQRRETESLRNAVLSAVAHDLKTPLTAIIGSMSSLQLAEHQLSERDRHTLVDSMLGEAHRLLDYMNAILNLARFEDAESVAAKQVVSADDVVDLTVKRMATRLRPYRLAVEVDDGMAFRGDERLLDIALGNILDNAVKHSPVGALIVIRTEAVDAGRFALVVEDQGGGMDADLRAEIFARRGAAASTELGAGLGLWIARRIVEAHGGTIALEPTPAGRGTRVALRLPRVTEAVLAGETA